jgi:hypothetical protein
MRFVLLFLLAGPILSRASATSVGNPEYQSHAKFDAFEETVFASIQELHDQLVHPSMKEEQKVQVFAQWIAKNITYDVTYTPSKSPLETANRGKGICGDYANLFKALCDISKIECHVISGHGKSNYSIGTPARSNHSWNAVKIKGQYHLFDLTWAAGHVTNGKYIQEFNKNYYMAAPERFILDHFPEDPKWQLLDHPITRDQYENAPDIDPNLLEKGIHFSFPSTGIIRSDTIRILFKTHLPITKVNVFRWGLHEFGMAKGEVVLAQKMGNQYEIILPVESPAAYRYQFQFGNLGSVTYKVVSPGYQPAPPSTWNLQDPHSLIGPYLHAFYAGDHGLLQGLNPGSPVPKFNAIPHAADLKKSLSGWFGDYESFYFFKDNGDILIPINGFQIILRKTERGYFFKEAVRQNS